MNNIPDLEKLTDNVLKFIQFVDKPETKLLRENNLGQYNFIVDKDFSELPVSIIRLLSDQDKKTENLEKIIDMINMLRDVKNGTKTMQTTENEFMEKRAEEYLYPTFGGKEKFYEIAEENKKKNKKKKK